jgi:hypothetical protein
MADAAGPSGGQLQAELRELRQFRDLYEAARAENAALREELRHSNADRDEAREQQAATAEVLRAIASSPSDLATVLQVVVETARQLCKADFVSVNHRDGDIVSTIAIAIGPERSDLVGMIQNFRQSGRREARYGRGAVSGRAIIDGQTVHVSDIEAVADEFPDTLPIARVTGWRASVAAPLHGRDGPIGSLQIFSFFWGP